MHSNQTQYWPAPAKLNLLLKIVGRRADGYHLLQTVFQFVDLCDSLSFSPTRDGTIHLESDIPNLARHDNLVVRAARLLQQVSDTQLGAEIKLIKRIPIGGGLGGGSSDAATTLLALNQLWKLNLEMEQLTDLGVTLGADVPVFINGHAAWAEGIGEILTPIDPPEPWYLVVRPDCKVPTGKIFGDCALTRDADRITIRDFMSGRHENDCCNVVTNHYPPVARALDWLSNYAEARLTGTGACIFAEFTDQQAAKEVYEHLPSQWKAWVCRGLNRSPLLEKIGAWPSG